MNVLEDFFDEMLREMREQTGTLKNFDTTLVLAIQKGMQPGLDALGNRLTKALDTLNDRLGSMNQDALQRMVEGFLKSLKGMTESELARMTEQIATLCERLEKVGEQLEQGGKKLSDSVGTSAGVMTDAAQKTADMTGQILGQSSDLLTTQIAAVAEVLKAGGASIDQASKGLTEALSDLERTVHEVEKLGREGGDALEGHIDQLQLTTQQQKTLLQEVAPILTDLTTAGGGLADQSKAAAQLAARLQDLTQVFDRTASGLELRLDRMVQNFGEQSDRHSALLRAQIQESLDGMSQRVATAMQLLDEGLVRTSQQQQATGQELKGVAQALEEVLAQLRAEIPRYADQVSEMHRELDGYITKLSSEFNSAVGELSGTVEELVDAQSRVLR